TIDDFVGANSRNVLNGTVGDGGPSTGPWGREPQVYGQPDTGLISPREAKSANGEHFEKPEPYLRVRITALDRNRRDILIRFDAQAKFQRFYEQIVFSNPQTIIPALPLAQTSAPSDEEVCEDPILLSDEEVRSFIESDFGVSSFRYVILGRRPPDEDEQLLQARFELTKLETQYIEAAKSVDKLSQTRKGNVLPRGLIDVATAEVHPPLAAATRKMGRSWHTYADLDAAQEISDRVILGDSLGVKETLLQRSLVLEEYQDAVKSTIAKRRNIERLKASSNIRPERVDDALEELEEANK
ncbi:2304_t:CDS:2, partial [Acaulospora colombiana]